MTIHSQDKAFVGRLLDGDEAAYDELFQVHTQKVYRFALARIENPSLAEECVQAALAKAIPKLGEYRGEASLLTWLCAFCRFEILNLRRKERIRGQEVELSDDLPAIGRALELTGASHLEPPEAQLLSKEMAHLIRNLLDHLPGRYGDILEWKYEEGLSVSEIARRLQVTQAAAQSTLARARQAFREGFAEVAAATHETVLNSSLASEKG
jgi:RNA polymerase sigma-70 factor (ECF subfamily)